MEIKAIGLIIQKKPLAICWYVLAGSYYFYKHSGGLIDIGV